MPHFESVWGSSRRADGVGSEGRAEAEDSGMIAP
jgi:hypothetical protein